MKSLIKTKLIFLSSSLCAVSLFIFISTSKIVTLDNIGSFSPQATQSNPTNVNHLVFGIASSGNSWPKRQKYAKLWWNKKFKGCVFVDNLPHEENDNNINVPPLCVSEDTSNFNYTYRHGGLRSAIRVARVVKETVELNHSNVRWYVFGDDDTIFFPENLVKTLSKYDHRLWYYVGAYSENYEGSQTFGFGMAFGGGGFVLSASLANVLAKVFDSCIERYSHLYGSDARVFSCISELGVGLTYEPGFHQVDLRGNIFGLLAAHPLSPLLSLHHPDITDAIFPNMTTLKSLQHLFEAANIDSQRILQQTVCYEKQFSRTVSVSWGYAVQVFQNNVLLPDVLRVQQTFKPWKENHVLAGVYTFSIREIHHDPCKRPKIFYLDNVSSGKDGTVSSYTKSYQNCPNDKTSSKNLEVIKVVTNKLNLDDKQLQNPRRQCCDVLNSNSGHLMEIAIRECKYEELIYMH
ncbi:putative ERV-F (C)1 provirus ancestral Env polyprotein [Trifolium repens]|nr:putative ERV-F (C)1 provirus ancestral Env polyprotein [Trifolium repens]